LSCKQAGAFAGISVNLLVFPLDTLKTRLQSPEFQKTYRSATGIAQRALWRNLYQGVGTVLLVAVPSAGVFFTTYEGLKVVLGSSSSTAPPGILPQPVVHSLSSSVAQLINCAVVTPAEVLKQNAQMLTGDKKKGASSPTMTVLRQLRRHPTKLWRGYTALAARDLPFTALQFPAFEYLKKVLIARRSRLKKGGEPVRGVLERAWIAGVSAGVAGSAAAWVTTPFDVVKTRMMLEAGQKDTLKPAFGPGTLKVRRSGFKVGREVLEKEGIRGMFRGGLVRATVTILGNGLYMGFYEGAKLYLSQKDEPRLLHTL
jgi:solute carrier family 25 S-adenosylmethionine transporter 26